MYWKKQNRHSNTAIKVVRHGNKTIGHIRDGISMVVAPALKKEGNKNLGKGLKKV